MKKLKIEKAGVMFITMIFFGAMLTIPSLSANSDKLNGNINHTNINMLYEEKIDGIEQMYDTIFIPKEDVAFIGIQNDIGYNCDAANNIFKGISFPVYIGEFVDDSVPGRGRSGTLEPNGGDSEDWYSFSVCDGQSMQGELITSENFDFELLNTEGIPLGNSATAEETGLFFIRIFANAGADTGDYQFSVTLNNQNDAGSGGDAGNDIGSAKNINPGSFSGYMSQSDQEDWYSFSVNSGEGIFVTLEVIEKSDYDIHLYNPSDELVYSAQYYGDDELEYPADVSGTWKIKLDMFPGWDTSKWPDDYFLYGSGAYNLELNIGGSAENPPVSIQPEINPVAQTFLINDDPNSNMDEYGYLAAVPAANYLEGGERYVSPIVYQGVDFIPTWFTTVDQTSQYLLDDWNAYLERHDIEAEEYILPSNPVEAAAEIALANWESSSTAVVVVDGSVFEDEITVIADEDSTLASSPDMSIVNPGDLKDFSGTFAAPMFIGSKYGAIHLVGKGDDFEGDTGLITPRYEGVMEDWWPFPYDSNGEDKDTFYPVTKAGIWMPYVTSPGGLEQLQVIKYQCDRYSIPIDNTDSSIEVTISTDQPSNLIVYLIDPEGNVRRPMMPHYNGGEIKPLHYWNGGHWQHDQDEFRSIKLEPHGDFSVSVHNAMIGTWTAIVVPYLDMVAGDVGFNGGYHINAVVREYNSDRLSAALSAANGAVIASMKHAPLLYVTEDSVPTETTNAISDLGISNIIFVNINGVSSASPGGSVTEYGTMQEVINAIKADENSENYITMVSMGTGEGYFAPAAMAAAYHVSPILNIGEAADAYNTVDKIASWREYGGDYYHGCLSVGHLPLIDEPIDIEEPTIINLIIYYLKNNEFPPLGLDLKLNWYGKVYQGIHQIIDDYGLDLNGREGYLFVSPRDTDIRDVICFSMSGNNSYAGHIPVETTAFSSAHIVRNVLYPALIYANPGKDVTTSQIMNYPDGYQWNGNDGNGYPNYATQELKEIFSSNGRFFEGHVIWDNLLERYNTGASISYYSGHGTGGSGISAQYKNIAEQFPFAEPRYEHLKDFDWWDSWRGYSCYDNQQTGTPRTGGASGYNSQEPNLYDIIHFKWVDQSLENLHSEIECWSSCTTGEHWGPMVYLSHGSALWYGQAGSCYGIQDDLHNMWVFRDALTEGKGLGEATAEYVWIFDRDYTTLDPTTLYGRSTFFQGGLSNVKVCYGDPLLTCYSPDWIEPEPVMP